jgi:hypothetical protein
MLNPLQRPEIKQRHALVLARVEMPDKWRVSGLDLPIAVEKADCGEHCASIQHHPR